MGLFGIDSNSTATDNRNAATGQGRVAGQGSTQVNVDTGGGATIGHHGRYLESGATDISGRVNTGVQVDRGGQLNTGFQLGRVGGNVTIDNGGAAVGSLAEHFLDTLTHLTAAAPPPSGPPPDLGGLGAFVQAELALARGGVGGGQGTQPTPIGPNGLWVIVGLLGALFLLVFLLRKK